MKIYAKVKTKEQLELASAEKNISAFILTPEFSELILRDEEADKSLKALKSSGGREVFLMLPYILREESAAEYKAGLLTVLGLGLLDGLVINNIDSIGMLMDIGYEGAVIGDEFLYAYNKEAIGFYNSCFKDVVYVAPPELTLNEIEALEKSSKVIFIHKIFGYQAMMITAQDIRGNEPLEKGGGQPNACFSFKNEKGDVFVSVADTRNGYSIIYNGTATYMIDKTGDMPERDFLVDLTMCPEDEAGKILDDVGLLVGGEEHKIKKPEAFTRGHNYKGIE